MTATKNFVSPGRLLAAFACAAVLIAGMLTVGIGPAAAKSGGAQSSGKGYQGGPKKLPPRKPAKPTKPAKSGVLKGNPSNKTLATIFLSLLKAKDMPGLNRLLDPAFLLQRGDAESTYLTKSEYLANPSVVEDYKVTDIVGTRNALNTVRVVRFLAENIQTINGAPVPSVPIPRISTFAKNKNGVWRLIAHANFSAPVVPTS